jgi:Leucine-rich repeat (LRR) protein
LDTSQGLHVLHACCTPFCADPYVLLSILRTNAAMRKIFPKPEDFSSTNHSDYPIDLNQRTEDPNRATALHMACSLASTQSDLNLVHILLKAGADVNMKDAQDNTPLDIALSLNNRSLVGLLLSQPGLSTLPKLENIPAYFSLTGIQLNSSPERISLFAERLDHLDLSQNQLASLPASYSQFANLTEINLANNHLRTFPAVILSLKKLQSINLAWNMLTHIPQKISELSDLEVLILKHNSLEGLPSSLRLLNLKKLNIKDNPLDTIPKEVVYRGTVALLSYLSQLDETVANWKRIKLLVLGEEATGKTR